MENNQQNILKIGIVGKRDITANSEIRGKIKTTISKILKHERVKSFLAYSAMAKGADTIFADVVNKEFSQPIKIVLPFDSCEYEKDFTDKESLAEYKSAISKFSISEVVTKSIPTNQEQRNDAYFKVGKYISDSCNYIIFIWDELKPRGKGGTAEILGYASQCGHLKGIEIIKVQPRRTDEINQEINSLLSNSDYKAVAIKKKYQDIWFVTIALGVLTAVCLALAISFEFNTVTKFFLSSLKILFIISGFILIKLTKVFELHPRLLKERLRAEKLRLLATYYHSDIPVEVSDITQEIDKELTSITIKVNSSIKNSYQSKWYKYYAIKSLISGQINYHKNLSENVIGSKPFKLELSKKIIYWVWFYIIFSHFFSLFLANFNIYIPILSDYHYPHELVNFFILALPALYAAIEGLLYFKEWGDFKKQSDSMITYLSAEQIKLDESGFNIEKFFQILNSVSNAMLADNKNWTLVLSKREAPHPIL